MITISTTITALTVEEAKSRAVSGAVDNEVIQVFREHYKYYIKTHGANPVAKTFANGLLIPSLIDLSQKISTDLSQKISALEEAVIRSQDMLAIFPQNDHVKKNHNVCVKLLMSIPDNGFFSGNESIGYVEIGTSDYDILADDPKYADATGVSVEPVPFYFNKLSTSRVHTKLQAAIVAEADAVGTRRVFYVDSHTIDANPDWPDWIRGCSSLDHPHTTAAAFLRGNGYNPADHIQSSSVNVMSLERLLQNVSACRIGFLKTDVEGHDPHLLLAYARFLLRHRQCFADRIQVEFNEQSTPKLQTVALRLIYLFGYTHAEVEGSNVVLYYTKKKDLRYSSEIVL